MYYIQCRIPSYERNDGCTVELQCSEFLSVIRRKGAHNERMAIPFNQCIGESLHVLQAQFRRGTIQGLLNYSASSLQYILQCI
jgi:hypothetical protein